MRKIKIIILTIILICISSCASISSKDNNVNPAPFEKPSNIETDAWFGSHEVLIRPIMESIEAQSKERLPFDEPKIEYGQQDGRLRPAWHFAYMHKRPTYIFNHTTYATFECIRKSNGKCTKDPRVPFVPQVCADFIIDSIDRAAGTWYSYDRNNPGRIVGNFDFRARIENEGLSPRRVDELVTFFKNHTDEFEIVFEGVGVYVGNEKRVKQFLNQYGTRLGDLILIHGKVPWDTKSHGHSFFVSGFDENGFVEKVTGNPVFPVKRSIRVEGGRTPKRRITHIIRFTPVFLKKLRSN